MHRFSIKTHTIIIFLSTWENLKRDNAQSISKLDGRCRKILNNKTNMLCNVVNVLLVSAHVVPSLVDSVVLLIYSLIYSSFEQLFLIDYLSKYALHWLYRILLQTIHYSSSVFSFHWCFYILLLRLVTVLDTLIALMQSIGTFWRIAHTLTNV